MQIRHYENEGLKIGCLLSCSMVSIFDNLDLNRSEIFAKVRFHRIIILFEKLVKNY